MNPNLSFKPKISQYFVIDMTISSICKNMRKDLFRC